MALLDLGEALVVRVLHLITSLRVGGAERQLLTLLRAFGRDSMGHTVAVLQSPGALEAEIESLRVALVRVGHRRRHALRTVGRIRSLIAREDVDVVHAHMHLAANYARLACMTGARARVVFTEHQQIEARSEVDRSAERFFRRWTALKITVSEAQRQQVLGLEGYAADSVVTVPNSVVTEEFGPDPQGKQEIRTELGIPDDAIVVGNVANHIEQKCLDRLIRSFDAAAVSEPRARLLLVGDGDLHESLKQLAAHAQHGNRIHFAGRRADIPRVLAAMDVFATTSRWEGMPINLLEAMTTGLPSINMAVGGIPSVIKGDHDGLLVEPGDESGFARALAHLLSDPERRTMLGSRAREKALAEHSANVNAERLSKIYRDLTREEAP